jgi:hypothetical protein
MTIVSCCPPTRVRGSFGKLADVDKIFGFISENPMAAVIVAGEIGFWVLIAVGLIARYLLKLRRTSLVLLAAIPVIDVLVLIATVIDISRGAPASLIHGLAAVYLGFSVVFGPAMVRWADVRFAHRFAGGPAPVKRPKRGKERERHEWREWGKCVLASAIAAAVLLVLVVVIGGLEHASPLLGWLPRLGTLTAIWFVAGPLWQTLSRDKSTGTVSR